MATAQSDAAPGLAPDAVRPFRAHVPQAALVDLRRRLAATRWPDRETVTDRSQGVQLASSPNMAGISIPAAVTIFPGEVYKPPKSWAARAYRNLVYYQRVDKGGHFAAWEEPDLFSAEVRAAFRSMR
ncbi:hypothetical protein D9M70_608510 [compost metagenome]